jgi:hypothetical protein
MKKLNTLLFITLVLSLFGMEAYAQVPQGFNFQAVAAGADGLPIADQEITVQIEIVKGTEEGDVVYTETHSVNTNLVGLFQLTIGQGTAAEGNNFTSVDWGSDNYFVGLGIDITNTGNFVSLGKTKLLSVPYALLAQDVVNGSGTGGEFVTELNFDASVDTAFTVSISGDAGDENNSAIIGEASTFGSNFGVEGKAVSQAGSSAFQVGTVGEVGGEGTGTHIGVFGSAINDGGTIGRRYGLYGQARSEGRENIGGFGVGLGPGDGEIVLRGDEFAGGEFNVGGFNVGMIGFARQNLNGNIGVRGYVYGEDGARSNRAVQAEARTTADGTNIGLQALVSGSFNENIGIEVDVYDETDARNLGAILNVGGSSISNVGLIVNADTAAMFNGEVIVNGINLNDMVGSGEATFLDVKNANELTVASMYAEGENKEFGGGIFLQGESTPNIRMGSKLWENATNLPYLQLFGNTSDGNGWYRDNLFMTVNSNGTDESGAIYLKRTNLANSTAEQTVEIDGGMGNISVMGSFYSDIGFNANNKAQVLGNLNETGAGGIEILDANNSLRLFADGSSGSFQVKRASDSGTIINMTEFSGGGQFLMSNASGNDFLYADASSSAFELKDSNGSTTVSIDAAFGNAVFSGTVTESSDLRLKSNISTLSNALDNTLALRGVSYTWKDENKTQATQIGVIAQEVEEIYPEFVRTDDEGMKSVNYSQMVAVLIEAVKELNAKIEVLESENTELRAQVDDIETMKAQINQLMTLISSSTSSDTPYSADK